MKKNRNKNFKTRMMRNVCIFVAGIAGASSIAAGVFSRVSNESASAADMSVNSTGLNNIGENQIQVLSDKINVDSATTIITTGSIGKMRSKCYTETEMQNGTYDSERDSQISFYSATKNYCDTMNITYNFDGSLSAGSHNVDGTVVLTWSNAAHDADGNAYDVKMYIDNIVVTNGTEARHPISIVGFADHTARYATQERSASELVGSNYSLPIYDLGASYDTLVRIVEPGTDIPVTGKNTVYIMQDLDQPDNYTGGYGTADSPAPYAESITLIDGVVGDVFVEADHILSVTNTSYGNNTHFSATEQTGIEDMDRSSIAFLGNASGFKYRWHGSECSTPFGWIGSKTVTTSTSGDYADKGSITPTDNEVLWKEDKSIVVTPDPGYYVSKITVDGQEINFTPDPDTGKVVYTFDDVIANHTIDAQFAPYNYKVTVRHYEIGTTTPVADPVVSDNHHTGDTYTSQPADVDGYRLVERPDPETVTFTDHDIEMIYYYAPVGNITVEYCDVDTKKCDLTEIVTDEGIDGDESRVCVEKKFDGYNFVNKEGDDCILSKDTTKIKYWYKKQPKNPVTADINVGGYAAAALGLITTAISFLLVIAKRRK